MVEGTIFHPRVTSTYRCLRNIFDDLGIDHEMRVRGNSLHWGGGRCGCGWRGRVWLPMHSYLC